MSYDLFATTFSESRKNLRWREIEYFTEYIESYYSGKKISILDVGCGNGRLLDTLDASMLPYSYYGIDESIGMINEAKTIHPGMDFTVLDMMNLDKLPEGETYDIIIFIASFHHLHNEYDRKKVLENTKNLLKPKGIIVMTNWNLMEEPNFSKYEKSHRGDGDFNIKIGQFDRFYHGFTVFELEELFIENRYRVIENRIFEGGRNIISIIESSELF